MLSEGYQYVEGREREGRGRRDRDVYLVRADGHTPFGADERAVEEEVDLLRVIPGLDVLVPVALDPDLAVDDHELLRGAHGQRAPSEEEEGEGSSATLT